MNEYPNLRLDSNELELWKKFSEETHKSVVPIFKACKALYDLGDLAIGVYDKFEQSYQEKTGEISDNEHLMYCAGQIAKKAAETEGTLKRLLLCQGLTFEEWQKMKKENQVIGGKKNDILLFEVYTFCVRAFSLSPIIRWNFLYARQKNLSSPEAHSKAVNSFCVCLDLVENYLDQITISISHQSDSILH